MCLWQVLRLMMGRANRRVIIFKITLNGTLPVIWRRIHVPADYDFYQFSVAIQQAMGWAGYHSYHFRMHHPRTSNPTTIGRRDVIVRPEDLLAIFVSETDARISTYFTHENALAIYRYDEVDGWEHTVRMEGILQKDPSISYPICVDGRGHCPPENCGGVDGFYELLQVLREPKHPQYAEKLKFMQESQSGLNLLSGHEFAPHDVIFVMWSRVHFSAISFREWCHVSHI